MNTLSLIGKQIADLFASMTPSARVMAGLMFGVIVVSLGWILTNSQGNSKTYILGYSPLSAEEIREAEKAFGTASLGDYEVVGSRIKVPSADKATYLKALADNSAMPSRWDQEIQKSLEVGMFDPPSLTNIRHREAKSSAFAQILKQLPSIDFAAVTMDEKSEGFARETTKVCAIQVKQEYNRSIDQSILADIAEQATTYFAGLKKEDVSVFDLGSANLYRATDDESSVENNAMLRAQTKWEEHYYRKVSDMLSHINKLKLMVTVALDNTLSSESEKVQYDPTGVTTSATSSRTDSENTKLPSGGRVGTAPNALNNPQAIATADAANRSKVKESAEAIKSQFGTEATITKQLGLTPQEVKIAVSIPESYFKQKWEQRERNAGRVEADGTLTNPPTPQDLIAIKTETLAEVEGQVSTIALGIRSGQNRAPFFQVTSYTDFPTPPIPEISLGETALTWLGESWSTLAMLGLVAVSLGMMFNWVKSQQVDPETEKQFAEGFGIPMPEPPEDELDLSAVSSGDSSGDSGFAAVGQEIKDDLSTLIKDNPDAAANMLKTWIGEAA